MTWRGPTPGTGSGCQGTEDDGWLEDDKDPEGNGPEEDGAGVVAAEAVTGSEKLEAEDGYAEAAEDGCADEAEDAEVLAAGPLIRPYTVQMDISELVDAAGLE